VQQEYGSQIPCNPTKITTREYLKYLASQYMSISSPNLQIQFIIM